MTTVTSKSCFSLSFLHCDQSFGKSRPICMLQYVTGRLGRAFDVMRIKQAVSPALRIMERKMTQDTVNFVDTIGVSADPSVSTQTVPRPLDPKYCYSCTTSGIDNKFSSSVSSKRPRSLSRLLNCAKLLIAVFEVIAFEEHPQ